MELLTSKLPVPGFLAGIAKPTPAMQVAPPATAAAAPADAPASSVATHVTSTTAVTEASLGQQVLGKVGSAQNRYLANQQLLGAVSHALTDRFAAIGRNVWSMLRGTSEPAVASEQEPAAG
jgi:hypothetical protein